ncbi:MAG: PrsW family intramembrane metalloprotease [Patescibacteria group bacterium]|nr:PrsW family intramembrane metalloprotease [Patescibacteria group bacterium]
MDATTFAYALMAGIVPSLVWLFFWTREDERQPEPRALLAACFLGGMAAVAVAIPAEKAVAGLATDQATLYIFWAAIEEALKFAAVALIALRSRWYDEPIDAMIYFVAVSLGFAALENTLFIMGTLSDSGLASGLVDGNMRYFGATLVHVFSSALVGFALGMTFYRGWLARIGAVVAALAAAIAAHAAFNIGIVSVASGDALKVFAWVWAAIVILIVLFEEVKAVRPADAPAINTSRI